MDLIGKKYELYEFIIMRLKALPKEKLTLRRFFREVDVVEIIDKNLISKIKFKSVYLFLLLVRANSNIAITVITDSKNEFDFDKKVKRGLKKVLSGKVEDTSKDKKKLSVIYSLPYTVDTASVPSITSMVEYCESLCGRN